MARSSVGERILRPLDVPERGTVIEGGGLLPVMREGHGVSLSSIWSENARSCAKISSSVENENGVSMGTDSVVDGVCGSVVSTRSCRSASKSVNIGG